MRQSTHDVIVVGGGAAGLFCAALCAQGGLKTLVIEKNPKLGRKILVSGGGRCNFTNQGTSFEDFVSSNRHFAKSALSRFSPEDFLKYVEAHKIHYFEKKMGQLFCRERARDILDMLTSECRKGGVEFKKPFESSFTFDSSFGCFRSQEDSGLSAPKLVIASGGLSFPKIGASDFGYRTAQHFGHKIVEPCAALVGLKTPLFEGLSGLSCMARVQVGEKSFLEDVLITHFGLSGPAILRASLHWNPGMEVTIDFLPEESLSDLESFKAKHSKKKIKTFLSEALPKRLAQHFAQKTPTLAEKTPHEVSKKDLEALVALVKRFSFVPEESAGWHKAEVTRGGVDCAEVSSKSMQSKKQEGLYFIGEVLDVTGQLGGFNFQWAWASAFVASQDLLERKDAIKLNA